MNELTPSIHDLLVRMAIGIPATVAFIALLVLLLTIIANRRGWKR